MPDFFAEEIVGVFEGESLQAFSAGLKNKSRSRGVDIAYQGINNVLWEETDTPLDRPLPKLNHLGLLVLKLRMPIILKDDFRFLLGASYRPEYYNISNFTEAFDSELARVDDTSMKSTAFQGIAMKSINETTTITFRFKASYNGDYNGFINFDHRYAIYSLTGLYGVNKGKNIEWSVGLTLNSSFRNRFVPLPIFLYNRNFNQRWGIELSLPASAKVRYAPKPTTILLAGSNFSSRNYRINVERPTDNNGVADADYILRHSEIQTGIEIEQQIVPWIWLHARMGYQINFRTTFDARNEFANQFAVQPGNTSFFRLGVFVSPPDKLLE
ncbi:MAG: DUF6268 family outer membrane beta-barrel protein [Bacteroidota bacterium]